MDTAGGCSKDEESPEQTGTLPALHVHPAEAKTCPGAVLGSRHVCWELPVPACHPRLRPPAALFEPAGKIPAARGPPFLPASSGHGVQHRAAGGTQCPRTPRWGFPAQPAPSPSSEVTWSPVSPAMAPTSSWHLPARGCRAHACLVPSSWQHLRDLKKQGIEAWRRCGLPDPPAAAAEPAEHSHKGYQEVTKPI